MAESQVIPTDIGHQALPPSGGSVRSRGSISGEFYSFASRAFAFILLVAAGLKAESLGSPSQAGPSHLTVTTFGWAQIAAEWLLGAWLLSGAAPAMARRVALATLVAFIAVSGWRLATGAGDCGCFGRVSVRPAWTLSLDVCAAIALTLLRPPSTASSAPAARAPRLWLRIACAVGLSSCLFATTIASATLALAAHSKASRSRSWNG